MTTMKPFHCEWCRRFCEEREDHLRSCPALLVIDDPKFNRYAWRGRLIDAGPNPAKTFAELAALERLYNL